MLTALTLVGVAQADVETARQNLEARLPSLPIDSLMATPIDGVYELITNGNISYVTEDAAYLISGEILDIKTQVNVTQARRSELVQNGLAALDGQTIDFPRSESGELNNVLYVFTDHTCPYCRKLHDDVPELQEAGITVKYLLYPRQGLGSKVHREMIAIWCSEDRAQAMDDAKNGDVPEFTDVCANPIEQHVDLARQAGLRGTPMLIFDNGTTVPGYQPAAEIIKIFKGEN